MQVIYNSKLYDTNNAKLIHIDTNGDYVDSYDFKYYSYDLYMDADGDFFLHNCTGNEEEIELLEYEDDVKQWLEDHAPVEIYIDLFGEPEE